MYVGLYIVSNFHRSVVPTISINGHTHPTARTKYMTAPSPRSSNGAELSLNKDKLDTRARNESVKYLDLHLPKSSSMLCDSGDAVGYASIRRDQR